MHNLLFAILTLSGQLFGDDDPWADAKAIATRPAEDHQWWLNQQAYMAQHHRGWLNNKPNQLKAWLLGPGGLSARIGAERLYSLQVQAAIAGQRANFSFRHNQILEAEAANRLYPVIPQIQLPTYNIPPVDIRSGYPWPDAGLDYSSPMWWY